MISKFGVVFAASLTGLAACVPGTVEDPDMFGYDAHDGIALGSYDPALFTVEEVKAAVAYACATRAVDKFSDKENAEGGMIFAARCADGGRMLTGRYEFERARDGKLVHHYSP